MAGIHAIAQYDERLDTIVRKISDQRRNRKLGHSAKIRSTKNNGLGNRCFNIHAAMFGLGY